MRTTRFLVVIAEPWLNDHTLGGLHNQHHFSNRSLRCRCIRRSRFTTRFQKLKKKKKEPKYKSAESQNIAIYSTYHGNNLFKKSYCITITAKFIYLPAQWKKNQEDNFYEIIIFFLFLNGTPLRSWGPPRDGTRRWKELLPFIYIQWWRLWSSF